MPLKEELNAILLDACTSDVIDYDLVETLLKQGAEPLGDIALNSTLHSNLYYEVVAHLFCTVDTPEDFYEITERFLRHGMDISRPTISYDDRNVLRD